MHKLQSSSKEKHTTELSGYFLNFSLTFSQKTASMEVSYHPPISEEHYATYQDHFFRY